ncbi:hypothetical protein BT63DRAFT_425336 [Microthyrium microscopicum]|uniref:STE24 endopeptidase n=1 Tax=Microthyrium microscopicum TaxID=703497 RepID=A0A6A6UDW4_9PEZI|nr:hypothetical protein BT63DRAFT_425336 [Microthyrium microscopicum]
MPTPIDRALQSKSAVLAFAGVITAASAWMIWGGDMFPQESDPTGDPETWSYEELNRWLRKRSLLPSSSATKQDLLERVKSNMRSP